MRIFPILTAALVAAALYLFVMERDTLRAIAGAQEVVAAADEAEPRPSGDPAVAVVVRRSDADEVEGGIVLRGRTEAARRVEVRAETSGLVISEPLRRGATISAGETLCEIDPGNRPAQLAEAEARLLEAQTNRDSAERLAERGFGAEVTAISNRASLQAAEARVDEARREIDRLRVVAPFDGLLESDTAEIGSLLQPGSVCATIIDLDPIKVTGFVPERSVERIKVGSNVGARLITGQEIAGEVTFVSRSADPDTRTFRVEAKAPNPDSAIRDGITAEIFVQLPDTPAHLLPQSALTLDDSGTLGIRAAVDGIAEFMPVTVVRDSVDGVWVTGLPDTVDVIVVGQDFVIDGQPVAVTREDASR